MTDDQPMRVSFTLEPSKRGAVPVFTLRRTWDGTTWTTLKVTDRAAKKAWDAFHADGYTEVPTYMPGVRLLIAPDSMPPDIPAPTANEADILRQLGSEGMEALVMPRGSHA